MTATKRQLLERAYLLFNERRVEELLAMMIDDVEWPNVAKGIVLRSHDAIRGYWEAQFMAASPNVSPVRFIEAGDDLIAVVEQRVDALDGTIILPPHEVFHRYAFNGDRVSRMTVHPTEAEAVHG